ncbi:MAG: ATP-dependent RNA helicase HrpA [Wenzhouxiangella sp.]|nr:ATP-dependent RNA helicase HrpA [Wenzhouxiangella sp.]
MSIEPNPRAVSQMDLPIATVSDDIKRAINAHPVVIVAGETGSGKSTQLPKLCLELGRGEQGMIGCTQPRRIAARSVARRVAQELDQDLGQAIGFQVRFMDQLSSQTRVKFMTDGILLSEIHQDRQLSRYDTLIIDEAHERSLNIDFLLGYLKGLLPRRPDLKLIITSATINTERFSEHFQNAPIIQVEGRTYPVDVEYQPPKEAEDLGDQVKRAIDRVSTIDPRGDILVFLPGERDIFHVTKRLRRAHYRHTDILPLYARLPAHHQDKIFSPGVGRRIVLSTNVAETSLTVPGIRFVIDSGLARISRYTAHSRVLRLPIEPIAQAACAQRAGRCGRVGPGVCVRLFDETDFVSRKEYTEPEIQRASLVGVILQMRALGLGDPEDFPFLDRPPNRLLGEAWQTLAELQAVDEARALTTVGQTLARLPVDARFGRMMIEAQRLGVVNEILVLVAAMSIGDVKDRPMDQQQAADQAHSAFVVPSSDFLTQLKLWQWWQATRQANSANQANKKAREAFLVPNKLHEWSQLYQQLKQMAQREGWAVEKLTLESPDAIHQALLSGLLAMVGRLDEQGLYEGVRGHRFRIFPGSVLARSQPAWVMSAERVETGQTYARMVAKINSDWLETMAGHLLKRRVFDPYWSRRQGRVLGFEQLALHALVIVPKRRIHYGPHDPKTARALFIRHALVHGEINLDADFLSHNQSLKALLIEQESKQRKRDLLASDDALVEFFDQLLPANIYTSKAFSKWYKGLDEATRQQWLLDQATLLREDADLPSQTAFPDQVVMDGQAYTLHYAFDPSVDVDGITLDCPLHLLNQLDQDRLEWLVPGLLEDKVAALIASLRKSQRRLLVPVKEYAQAAVESLGEPTGGLLSRLSGVLTQLAGLDIHEDDFNLEKVPKHLIMRVRVLDGPGQVLGESRDLLALKAAHEAEARAQFMSRQASQWQQDGLTIASLSPLPTEVTTAGGHTAWPAWVDQNQKVGVRLFDTPDQAELEHEAALLALCRLDVKDKIKYLKKNNGLSHAAQVIWTMQEPIEALVDALTDQLILGCIRAAGGWTIRDRDRLDACLARLRQAIIAEFQAAMASLDEVVRLWHECTKRAQDLAVAVPKNIEDIQSQLSDLVYPGFVRDIDVDRLKDYKRYLQAIQVRMDGLEQDPKRDFDRQQQLAPFWLQYLEYLAQGHWYTPALDEYRWAVEEYRVQLFAQALGTQQKVSPKRLEMLWQAVSLS